MQEARSVFSISIGKLTELDSKRNDIRSIWIQDASFSLVASMIGPNHVSNYSATLENNATLNIIVSLFPALSPLLSSPLLSSSPLPSSLISSLLFSSHLISSHLISSHLISSHLISSHLISSPLISSPLISSHLLSSSFFFLKICRCTNSTKLHQWSLQEVRSPSIPILSKSASRYRTGRLWL